jgi:hypothetical protein
MRQKFPYGFTGFWAAFWRLSALKKDNWLRVSSLVAEGLRQALLRSLVVSMLRTIAPLKILDPEANLAFKQVETGCSVSYHFVD